MAYDCLQCFGAAVNFEMLLFYYRGLKEWDREKGFLMDICITAQGRFKAYLDYFRISY